MNEKFSLKLELLVLHYIERDVGLLIFDTITSYSKISHIEIRETHINIDKEDLYTYENIENIRGYYKSSDELVVIKKIYLDEKLIYELDEKEFQKLIQTE
ncbi:MAG: hypothetical protein ACK5NU_03900 [Fusobacterium ulcerans]|uniref:hypothetical protein n=1 Tax=Fusobacterium ulcerans TaxID=861 RepID=UPI003A8414FB